MPFSQCLSYWIYSGKQILVRKYLNKSTYASDENIKYSGFGEKIPNYEEQGMKSPQEWIYTYPYSFLPSISILSSAIFTLNLTPNSDLDPFFTPFFILFSQFLSLNHSFSPSILIVTHFTPSLNSDLYSTLTNFTPSHPNSDTDLFSPLV